MELRESRRMIISSSPHKESVTGSVATFKTDMAKPLLGCNVGIDLVQDLHGQTKPYPAGGGKNLFNLNIGIHENLYRDDNGNEVATENSNYTDPLGGFKPNTTYTIKGTLASSTNGSRIYFLDASKQWISRTGSSADNPRQFTTPANCYYVEVQYYRSVGDLSTVQIEEGSSATSYAPYENICPITGWTGVNLNNTGRNIFDVDHTTYVNGKYIDASGNEASNNSLKYTNEYIKVKPNTTYSVRISKTDSQAVGFTVPMYDSKKNFISRSTSIAAVSSNVTEQTGSFTTTADTQYIRFSFGTKVITSSIQIEEGSTAHTYEEFGQLINVEFPAVGKNKIFVDHTVGTALSRGLTATKNSDGSITVKGTYTGTANGYIGSADDAVLLPAGTYILTGSVVGYYANYGLRLYINDTYGFENGEGKTITLTEPTSIPVRIHVYYVKAKDVPLPAEGLTFHPMLRVSTESDTYEPYTTTVFGGDMDLLTGILTVRKIRYIIESVSLTSASTYAYLRVGPSGTINKNKGICNILEYCTQTIGNMKDNQFREVTLSDYDCIAFKVNGTPTGSDETERLASVNAQLAALSQAGNPLTVVSVLATPYTIQLTPSQLTALVGENNIWSDTGNATVQFWTH